MPGMRKGKWSQQEDKLLARLAEENSVPTTTITTGNSSDRQKRNKVWGELAAQIVGRTAKQCRVRWYGRLSPAVNRSAFTREEDEQMLALHKSFGNKWAAIAIMLEGRTSDSVKVRISVLHRRGGSLYTHEPPIVLKRSADAEAESEHQPKRQKLQIDMAVANAVKLEIHRVSAAQKQQEYLEPLVSVLCEVQDYEQLDFKVDESSDFHTDLDAWLDEAIPTITTPVFDAEESFDWWAVAA